MTDWIYRTTQTGTAEETTAELLESGFLCARVCKDGGKAMPRVSDVRVERIRSTLSTSARTETSRASGRSESPMPR